MGALSSKGSWKTTEDFLKSVSKDKVTRVLEKYGREGVNALANATPIDSGLSAHSWSYSVTHKRGVYEISWFNSYVVNGTPVVILLQYGHGTGTGGYVQGQDFINPALRPIFDKISDEVWKAVTSA